MRMCLLCWMRNYGFSEEKKSRQFYFFIEKKKDNYKPLYIQGKVEHIVISCLINSTLGVTHARL